MRKLKAAVIGAGFMGRTHVEALRRLGFVDVVAVAAISDEEAKKFAAGACIDWATADVDSILADKSIDGVHICTPNALHAPIAMKALKAGKHVWGESPGGFPPAKAKKILERPEKKTLC